jgi:hypothetical protein
MATEEIALKITTDASQTEKSVKSIRQELREAQQSAIALSREFGDLSPEALAAAKKVANLKDEVGDLKQRIDALNPDAKFKAFSSSLQGVAGGFAGVQGAIGLFGTESAELEKQLLKVQSALALSQGLDSLLEARDSFKTLGTLVKGNVTKAFSTLRGAIIATGIGALVVGVGLLIANFDTVKRVVLNFIPGLAKVGEFIGKLVTGITDFVGVTSEAERAYDRLKKSTEGSNNEIDRQVKLLQAQGGQEKKIAELQKKKIDNTINVTKANKNQTDEDKKNLLDLENEKKVIGLEEQNRVKKEAADRKKQRQEEGKQAAAEAKAKADEIKKQTYETDKELQLARLEGREREKKQLEFEQQEALKAVEGNAKATQSVKDLYVIKGKELNKQFAEEDKKNEQELQDFKNELYLDSITNAKLREEEERKLALEKKVKDIEESKLSAVEKAQATQDAINAWQFEQDAKDFETQLAKDEAALAKTEGDFANDLAILEAQRELILSNTTLTEDARVKLLDDNSKKAKAIGQAEVESKKAQLEEIKGLFSQLAGIAGESTAVGKALALANIGIDTAQAISSLTKASEQNPANGLTFGAAGTIQFATGLIRIAANIKKAKDLLSKVKGGAGGNLPSIPGGGASAVAPTQAPIGAAVQVTNTQTLGTTDVNVQNQGAIKAFVVESDITDSQDRVSKIKAAATL